ncbi:SDR family oxidoreductase [uncultured Paludibaculum sp.]|uniref:SDR family NAD(P)-dependent oxidoreductase n=1 Tax=uncultured Paludibaculum sp. TaxID=1765020 RepID=UPI002AAC2A00|nr:SDR family oxidoreductase [uncultured Paludibaculum sp.]
MFQFKEKTVLIVGAGRGIGKRLAIGFANAGARIGLLARSKAELDLANLEIEHAGGISLRLRADVREYEQVAAAVDRMRVQFGPADMVVCAHAVFGSIGPLSESKPTEWGQAMTTNMLGAMNVCHVVLPAMLERRAGKIILLVGPGSEGPRPNFSAYSATQAALVRFAETLAEEVRENNVQVNCMNPGPTYTSLTDEILGAGERAGWKEIKDATHIRTTGGTAPDKQILLAQFLASERSNHISGKLISIHDDWRKLENANAHTEMYTLRRLQRV